MHSGNLSADMVYLGMTTKICSDVSQPQHFELLIFRICHEIRRISTNLKNYTKPLVTGHRAGQAGKGVKFSHRATFFAMKYLA